MVSAHWKRGMAAALVAVLGLALSACLLSPGKFASTLDLRKDGRFTFAYSGEINILALSKLAQMGDRKAFSPEPCYDDDMKQRPCSTQEQAAQRQAWEETQKANAEKKKQDADNMKAILGGLDPADPRAAEELGARLRRQVGWKSVIYKGNGLYVVDFALAGRIDHDFAFPSIERFPMANPFVQLSRRADGSVRVDAPGFTAANGGGNPFAALMAMGEAKSETPPMPQIDGTFTVTTDGQILANNTDEGPQPDPAGQRLGWIITPRSAAAPTALVKLAPAP